MFSYLVSIIEKINSYQLFKQNSKKINYFSLLLHFILAFFDVLFYILKKYARCVFFINKIDEFF